MKYDSQQSCSGATHTPLETLKLAKANGCPGFIGHRIDFDLVKPWLVEHESDLELWANDSMSSLKMDNLRKDIEKKTLEIKRLKKEFLDPREVKMFLENLLEAQTSILKKVIKELPAKIVGKTVGEMEVETERAVGEVFTRFKAVKASKD